MYKLILFVCICLFVDCSGIRNTSRTILHDTITDTKIIHDTSYITSEDSRTWIIHDTTFTPKDTVFKFIRVYTEGHRNQTASTSLNLQDTIIHNSVPTKDTAGLSKTNTSSDFNVLTIICNIVVICLIISCLVLKLRK